MSHGWFQAAAAHEAARDAAIGLPPRTLHPLLVWNALPRGGASQVGAGGRGHASAPAHAGCGLAPVIRLGLCTCRAWRPTPLPWLCPSICPPNTASPLPLPLPPWPPPQYHGHAQVMLSEAPFPFLQQEREAVEAYDLTHGSMSRG